jgi:hypothetical protein
VQAKTGTGFFAFKVVMINRLLTIIAWLVITAILLPVSFFAVIALAGPHGGVLPEYLHRPVLLLAWTILLAAPVWAACRVHQRLVQRESTEHRALSDK